MSDNKILKICTNCKVECKIDCFKMKRSGYYYNQCNKCAASGKRYREKNREILRNKREEKKCLHGKQPSQCMECRPDAFCPHGKRPQQCRECRPDAFCPHEKFPHTCRECRPDAFCPHGKFPHTCRQCLDNESVIKYTFRKMIFSSRNCDKKYNRLDEDHFIDMPFLYIKMTDYPNLECYHCKKNMSFKPEKKIDLITIERLNNKIGHIKSNCEFCCLDCNLKKISNKLK